MTDLWQLVQEIRIHKALDHDNIVKFVNFVEDKDFVYIILEMCSNRSLLRMIRTRKHICEAELRYYLHQMVSGLTYLKQELVSLYTLHATCVFPLLTLGRLSTET